MTIIKHGRKMDDVKFVCEFCGCEFCEDVYHCSRVSDDDEGVIVFAHHCPDCGELCCTEIPLGKNK